MQYNADDVFTDIVYVSFNRRHENASFGFRFPSLFGFNEWDEMGNGLLHNPRTFDYLWQKHFSRPKQVANPVHARHEGALNDFDWAIGKQSCRFGILKNILVNALY